MVVSDRFRFVFVHIPKSGGTSCGMALRRALPFYERRHRVTFRKTKHLRLEDAQHSMQAPPPWKFFWQKTKGDPSDYFRFAFVRDPWDRMVSLYHYLKRGGFVTEIQDVDSFDEFISRVEAREPWLERMYSLQPQLSFITDAQGNMLADFVGRFERLEQDFQVACDGIGLQVKLPHVNASRHAQYRKYYTPETAEVIHERFRADIEAFGYSFGDAHQLRNAA